MATLLRHLGVFNFTPLKHSTQWRLCNKVHKIPVTNTRPIHKSHYFGKPKVPVNHEKSFSITVKITLGLTAGITVKLLGDNTVFCRAVTESSTRLVDIGVEESVKEPAFNWKKFWKFLQPYWKELAGAILAAVVCALLNIQIPRALGSIADLLTKSSIDNENFFSEMKIPALKVISYYTLQSLFTFFYIALLANVGEGVAKRMKVELFSSIMNQDIAFFDKNRTGEIINRLTVDIQDFKSSFKMIISQGLRTVTQIIGCSISLYFISPFMTGVLMVVVPTVILGGRFAGSFLRQLSYQAKSQAAKVTLAAEEAIGNIRTVRSFGMEEVEKKILNEQAEICKKLNIKLGYGIGLFQAGANLFLNGIVLGTIYIGGYMMTTSSISAGDLMAFLVAVQILQRSFAQMSSLFGCYTKGKHAGARVFEMIDLPQGKTLKEGKKIPYHSLIPNVHYDNVVFSYPSRPNKDILKKISLHIPEGKTVAIVGSSGSGKSTLASLLQRFYDVEEGSIYVGGEDIKTLSPSWLRKNVIGFISQEPILFATTVMENIRYGKPNATDEEVIKAAKLAYADDFIRDFPEGYKTIVGERGVSVSGGQKQRIAIARALLKNPSILILDEATSALDSESEKAVQNALDNVTKSRTTIIIAHRLSSVRNADLIVVLDNGVIVESGTHRELLAQNGKYAALVAQQVENNNS